jgi:hypothetical protein
MEMKDKTIKLKNKTIKLSWRSWKILEWVIAHPQISTSAILQHFRKHKVEETNEQLEGMLNKLYQAGLLTLRNNLWVPNGVVEKVE